MINYITSNSANASINYVQLGVTFSGGMVTIPIGQMTIGGQIFTWSTPYVYTVPNPLPPYLVLWLAIDNKNTLQMIVDVGPTNFTFKGSGYSPLIRAIEASNSDLQAGNITVRQVIPVSKADS